LVHRSRGGRSGIPDFIILCRFNETIPLDKISERMVFQPGFIEREILEDFKHEIDAGIERRGDKFIKIFFREIISYGKDGHIETPG
jgi:hypothetical protein